jgi:hypothetical protein
VFAVLAALAMPRPAAAAIQTRHVVIVSIDGGRWTETLGHPTLTWHPRIGIDLAAIGAQPARFENIGITNTNPGHSALVTGTLQPIANDGSERPHKPTVFEYLRKQKGTAQSLCRLYIRKQKLDVLAYSDHSDYGSAYGATVSSGHLSDLAVYTAARAGILANKPVVTLVHFGDPDFEGHSADWAGYLATLRLADSLTWELWTAIQADPVMGGKTTLFVSNDHGRHDDAHGGYMNHGDGCDGCRHIILMMAGPDNFTGYQSAGVHEQRAVARTAGWLLGVSMPLAEGRVLDDLLLEPSAPFVGVGPGVATPALSLTVSPNPTRGVSEVRLTGAAAARARVDLLDASGRRIVDLVRAGAAPNGVAWRWDGRDGAGRELPPGHYFVRATGTDVRARARLVKLR